MPHMFFAAVLALTTHYAFHLECAGDKSSRLVVGAQIMGNIVKTATEDRNTVSDTYAYNKNLAHISIYLSSPRFLSRSAVTM
jgi:hypothetical protein